MEKTISKEEEVVGIVNRGYEEEEPDLDCKNSSLNFDIRVQEKQNQNETKVDLDDDDNDVVIKQTEVEVENESPAIVKKRKGSGVEMRNGSIQFFNSKQFGSLDSLALEKSKSEEVAKTGWRKHGGILFAFLGSVTVTLASLTVKVLHDYHPFTLGLYRYVASTVFTIPLLLYFLYCKKTPIFESLFPFNYKNRDQWILLAVLIAASSSNCGAFVFRYFSVQYLTVADGTVLSLSGAVFVVFLAHCCLGEKCGVASLLIAVFTFSGVIIIARPPMITGESEFNEDTLLGTLFGIAAMINWSIVVVTMRKTRKIHFIMMLLFPNIWGIMQCGTLMYIIGVTKILPTTWEEALVLTALVTLSYVGSVSVIFAMKYDSAVSYSLIRSGDILFAYFWQFLFLSVIPDAYSIIGAVIVMSGILLSTFRKWVLMQPPDSKLKQRFSFLA